MINVVTAYFDRLFTEGDMSVLPDILDKARREAEQSGSAAAGERAERLPAAAAAALAACLLDRRSHLCPSPLQTISHKDMVRNIGRLGLGEVTDYLNELHKQYPGERAAAVGAT